MRPGVARPELYAPCCSAVRRTSVKGTAAALVRSCTSARSALKARRACASLSASTSSTSHPKQAKPGRCGFGKEQRHALPASRLLSSPHTRGLLLGSLSVVGRGGAAFLNGGSLAGSSWQRVRCPRRARAPCSLHRCARLAAAPRGRRRPPSARAAGYGCERAGFALAASQKAARAAPGAGASNSWVSAIYAYLRLLVAPRHYLYT